MKRALGWIGACLVLASPVFGADENFDAIDDSIAQGEGSSAGGSNIAIVNTGDGSIGAFTDRLAAIGETATLIPVASDYSVLSQYDLVILPTSHGSNCCRGTLTGLAGDYHDYVEAGGCLYVAQPNPFDQPGQTAGTPWVPYELVLYALYDINDCPPQIVDPSHCVAQGVTGDDLPFPGDTVTSMASDWDVVSVGPVTGNPSVLTATYGNGSILVELGHPSPSALCPYSNAGFENMVSCCVEPGPTPTIESSWGKLKTNYR